MMKETVWHQDGHRISLELDKSEIYVTTVTCPVEADCVNAQNQCVVRWGIDAFGLECNVGTCPPHPEIEIAWSFVGNIDRPEEGQLWIIPVDDYMYGIWVDSIMGEANPIIDPGPIGE